MTGRPRRLAFPRIPAPQRAAWRNLAAKLAGAGLSFLLYVVLARLMTPEAFADVAVVLVWSALAAVVATLCMPLVVVRFVAEGLATGDPGRARGVVRFALVATLGAATALALIATVPVLAGWVSPPRDLGVCILIAAALLPPSTLLIVLAGVLQGLQRVAGGELLTNVTRPALILVALIGVWWWQGGRSLSAPVVLVLYLVATAAIVPASIVYARAVRPAAMTGATPLYDRRTWLRTALGFAGVLLAAALNERVDMLVLGVTAPPPEIAVYAVAVRFAQIVVVATSAVTAVLAPQLFDHVADLRDGRPGPIEALVRRNARTIAQMCLLACGGFALLGPLLLALFGADYARAYAPLVILAAGQLLAALFGPGVMVATFIGAPRIAVGALASGIVVNGLLNAALAPAFGARGAAVATAVGTVAAAATAWAWLRWRFRLDTAVLAVQRHPAP